MKKKKEREERKKRKEKISLLVIFGKFIDQNG